MTKRNTAYMQLTRKCNNKCVFCSNPCFDKEIEIKEIEKRIRFYKEKGINELTFSGGEPTECQFLPEAIKLAIEYGMEPKIITNGVNLSDLEYAKRLKKAGLNHLHISIHSHIEKDSDLLTSKKGHFKKSIKGIKNCIQLKMQVDINSVINSLNAKYLLKFVEYFTKNFPEIKHYVFNNIDLGEADKQLKSRAWENKWVIARFVDMEIELFKAAKFLENKRKTYRIERVPLCYMGGFEHFSTETRKIAKKESYKCIFIEKEKEDLFLELKDPREERRYKGKNCEKCLLNSICAGLCIEYYTLFGDSELFPIFKKPEKIIRKIE